MSHFVDLLLRGTDTSIDYTVTVRTGCDEHGIGGSDKVFGVFEVTQAFRLTSPSQQDGSPWTTSRFVLKETCDHGRTIKIHGSGNPGGHNILFDHPCLLARVRIHSPDGACLRDVSNPMNWWLWHNDDEAPFAYPEGDPVFWKRGPIRERILMTPNYDRAKDVLLLLAHRYPNPDTTRLIGAYVIPKKS